jgi:hypothetical protein
VAAFLRNFVGPSAIVKDANNTSISGYSRVGEVNPSGAECVGGARKEKIRLINTYMYIRMYNGDTNGD